VTHVTDWNAIGRSPSERDSTKSAKGIQRMSHQNADAQNSQDGNDARKHWRSPAVKAKEHAGSYTVKANPAC
jgi:hypothetical protein